MRRLSTGGRIDRARPLSFSWDGRPLTGFAGDTLASALLGAGVDVIGTSASLDRPRGVMGAGLDEATAFAQVTSGGATEPLVRMTGLPLYQGLVAEGGRRITKGVLKGGGDTARFDKRFAHCDLLVVGAGPAGLAAALTASRAGARVILVETDTEVGGALLRDEEMIGGETARAWIDATLAALRAAPETRVLTATTAALMMDQNGVLLAQRVGAHFAAAERGALPEQRLWHVRARRIVLATGALERPLVFQDNDRPGVMLAGAARSYLHRHALAPTRGLVFTTNDDAYRTALAWHAAGVELAGIVDVRPPGGGALRQRAVAAGITVWTESVVEGTTGHADGRLQRARVRTPAEVLELDTDLLAVSGGYEPNLNLHLQMRGATTYDARLGVAVPAAPLAGQWIVGAARGELALADCLRTGDEAAREALSGLDGVEPVPVSAAPTAVALEEDAPSLTWRVPAPDGDERRSFIDLHRDATVAGVERAVNAGVRHIEHVKRFTLVGTGVEQGRSSKTNTGMLTASLTDRPPSDVGTSGSRPPSEPLPFHLLAGRASGERYEPVRTSSMHPRHEALGAVFEPAGQWLRPSRFPLPGETPRDTVRRECRAARTGVAIMDASTLGKIDVRGPDAVWVLDQLYVNAIAAIAVGRARYSVMCHLDGSILDDGVIMRLGPQRFFVTTSTGHAATVVDSMEEWLQSEWPSRRAWFTSITEQFATVAVVGPKSRAVVARVSGDIDVSNEAFPFLAVRHGTVAGIDGAQVARVSFSGELAFELSVPWHAGPTLWDALVSAGGSDDITPYGLDALQVLRMEKGFIIVGQDTEALTTPYDAGLGWLVSKQKDFVGRRSMERPAPRSANRAQLVGFVSDDGDEVVPEGAGLVTEVGPPPMPIQGYVSSSCWSDALGRPLGLALVRGGRTRHGEVLYAPLLDGRVLRVRLVDPVHYDPKGARRDG